MIVSGERDYLNYPIGLLFLLFYSIFIPVADTQLSDSIELPFVCDEGINTFCIAIIVYSLNEEF